MSDLSGGLLYTVYIGSKTKQQPISVLKKCCKAWESSEPMKVSHILEALNLGMGYSCILFFRMYVSYNAISQVDIR